LTSRRRCASRRGLGSRGRSVPRGLLPARGAAVITRELMGDFALSAAALATSRRSTTTATSRCRSRPVVMADRWGRGACSPRARRWRRSARCCSPSRAATRWRPRAAADRRLGRGRLRRHAQIAGHWFAPERFAMLSAWRSALRARRRFSGVPLRLLVDAFGWRGVLAFFGRAHSRARGRDLDRSARRPGRARLREPFARAARKPRRLLRLRRIRSAIAARNVWLVFLISGGVSARRSLSRLWGVPFLVTHYGCPRRKRQPDVAAARVLGARGAGPRRALRPACAAANPSTCSASQSPPRLGGVFLVPACRSHCW